MNSLPSEATARSTQERAALSRLVMRRAAGRAERRRGVAMLETAAVVIVLTPLFLGMVQYGRMSHATEIVTNLAREGARFGSQGAATTDASISKYIMDQAATTYIGNEGLVVSITPPQPVNTTKRKEGEPMTVTISYDLTRRLFMPARWMVSRYESNTVDSACASAPGSCWVMRVDPGDASKKTMEQNDRPVRNVLASKGEANRPMYSAAAQMRILAVAQLTPPPPAAIPTPTPKPPPTPAPTAGPTNTPAPTTPPPTPGPTNTPAPTNTPRPTNTPSPTATAGPSPTPRPTNTPRPTAVPTNTPKPTPTPLPGS